MTFRRLHTRALLILPMLFGWPCSDAAGAAADRSVVRIQLDAEVDVRQLDDMALDFASSRLDRGAYVVVTPAQRAEIHRRGFLTEVTDEAAATRANLADPEYHTTTELWALMDSLATLYPALCVLDTLGSSEVRNYVIQGLKISDHPTLDEDEPAILYDGLHHAREPVSTEVCIVIMRHLLSQYGILPDVTRWVDHAEIWVVPMLNPDGWEYIVDSSLTNPWWRKNFRDNDSNGVFNPDFDGVDVNRNYDFNWALGGSGNPASWVYRGPAAFSESEARAKRDLALEQRFVASISYHSFGEAVLYSWSELPAAPDQALISSLATGIASLIPTFPATSTYTTLASDCQNGYSRCWMYAELGTLEFTLETAPSFVPSGAVGQQVAQDNLQGALFLLDRLFGPGITGHVTDTLTQEPLAATVRIVGIDDPALASRTSDSAYGRYHRLLLPGVYSVEVSRPGYATKTVSGVVVGSDTLTVLDIALGLPCPILITGDLDASGQITSADIIYGVNFVFKGGADPLPCRAAADVNCDGVVTSADLIYQVNFVFKSGASPCNACPLIPATWSCP